MAVSLFLFGHIRNFSMRLRPVQVFGHSSLHVAEAANHVFQGLDTNVSTAHYTTQHPKMGPVMFIT